MQYPPSHGLSGKLIVIDGSMGSGKSTQIALLQTRIAAETGKPVQVIKFPRYEVAPYGPLIRKYLDDPDFPASKTSPELSSLPYANDRLGAKPILEGWLGNGDIVLADRYVASNMAYQGAKLNEKKREEYLAWLHELEFGYNKIPREDGLVYLDVSPSLAIRMADARGEASGIQADCRDGLEQDDKDVYATTRVYRELADRYPYWHMIKCNEPDTDVLLPVATIAEMVWRCVQPLLK